MAIKENFFIRNSILGLGIFGLVSCSGNNLNKSENLISGKDIYQSGIVVDGPINDESFNQSAWEGMKMAEKENGWKVSYREPKGPSEYLSAFNTFIDQGDQIIFGGGFRLEEETFKQSLENPSIKFVSIDGNVRENLPSNFMIADFAVQNASFLAGYLASQMSETGKIGFIGGIKGAIIDMFDYGFQSGVYYGNPKAQIVVRYSESFTDASKGKSLGALMLSQGVDVIFHAASVSGNGMIEAVREKQQELDKEGSERHVWAIGVDMDQYNLAPEVILASVVKRVDLVTYEILKEFKEDSIFYGGEVKTYGLLGDFVGLSETSSIHVPSEVLEKVSFVKEKVEMGEIIVPKTKEEFTQFKLNLFK